jgi:hypothetical protein
VILITFDPTSTLEGSVGLKSTIFYAKQPAQRLLSSRKKHEDLAMKEDIMKRINL